MWTSSRRNRLAALALALAVAGCLHATRLDSDGDGVDDIADNCPSDYNPDQNAEACNCPSERLVHRDLDGDGVDDGCDQCIGAGPTGVDSDGDGIDDGCDPCVGGVSTIDSDDDHDGIPDGCDTCVGFIGVDIDRDGIDDSCDACLAGPPDDQDGDGVEDGCDACPVIAATDNAHNSIDADLIGDACDPWPTTNDTRLVFDGFRVEDSQTWDTLNQGSPPVYANDTVALGKAFDGSLPSVLSPVFLQVLQTYQLMARVHPGAGAGDQGGLFVFQVQPNSDLITDYVACTFADTGSGQLVVAIAGKPVVKVPVEPLNLPPGAGNMTLIVALVADMTTGMISCQVRDPNNPKMVRYHGDAVYATLASMRFGVAAYGSATFDWFEAIQGGPLAVPPTN